MKTIRNTLAGWLETWARWLRVDDDAKRGGGGGPQPVR